MMKDIKKTLKNSNKIILILGLVITLFFVGLFGGFIYKSLSKPKISKDNTVSLSSVIKRLDKAMETVKNKSAPKEDMKKMDAGNSKDSGKSVSCADLLLKGVAKNRGMAKVFLNDQVLCVGDELDGYTVQEIDKDGVKLRDKDGYESSISLEKE